MKTLQGKASDIILDYIEGRYDLKQDHNGLSFINEDGEIYEVSDEVSFYLNLIEDSKINL